MGKDAPSAPDPYAVSAAQTASNKATAEEQARLAMTGQSTPWGSIQYVTDPTSPSGYRAVSQLSPEQQALFGQQQDVQALYGNTAGNALSNVDNTINTPFNLDAARGTVLSDVQRKMMDPMWATKSDDLDAQLLNRGIRQGSDAYDTATRQFGQQKDDAYDKMFLDSYTTANNAALQQRNIPFTDLASLWGQPQQVQNPQMAQTPTPGVAATDVSGNVNAAYQQQMAAYNAQMGGIFGLGSAALGGWAKAGFPGVGAAASMISDERMKTDIRKVGDDPRGWGVYTFRYIWDGIRDLGTHIGFMAQEVEKIRPDAVHEDPLTGIKAVNYDALAMA